MYYIYILHTYLYEDRKADVFCGGNHNLLSGYAAEATIEITSSAQMTEGNRFSYGQNIKTSINPNTSMSGIDK